MGIAATIWCEALPQFVRTLVSGTPDALFGADAGLPEHVQFFPALETEGVPPQIDALLFDADALSATEFAPLIRRCRLRVQRFGAVFLTIHAAQWQESGFARALTDAGLGLYRGWFVEQDSLRSWDLVQPALAGQMVLRFQRATYDPAAHARTFSQAGDPGAALTILEDTPGHWLQTEEQHGIHAAERLVCHLAQERLAPPERRLDFLVSALYWYTRACTYAPAYPPAYQCLAAFWRRVGRPDMGRRLLQTVHTILPAPELEEDLRRYTGDAPTCPSFDYPEADASWRPRLLYLSHPESDYQADLLYDGMRRLLGADQVIEYPWKPTVHGERLEEANGYPCTFHWSDGPRPLDDIVRMAGEGAFDAILVSDTLGTLPLEVVRAILAAAPDTPRVIVDTWDECGNYQDIISESLGLGKVAGYFKREMVAGLDYGPNAWPLPLSYPDDRIPRELSWEDRAGVFFAGKLMGGARRLQLSWLGEHLPISGGAGVSYSQEEYSAMLGRQLIGLCMFGNGFDTVRYWELPAHGVLLAAERSPLVIPYDYVDGKHAVLYEHVGELREKLEYYLAHHDEAIAIAQAGHQHFLGYHTSTARARQFLGALRERLRALR